MKSIWDYLIARPAAEAQALQQKTLADDEERRRANLESWTVLLSCPILLTLQYYWVIHNNHIGTIRMWLTMLPDDWQASLGAVVFAEENRQLVRLTYWAGSLYILYVGIPVLLLKTIVRRPPTEYGLKMRGAGQHAWVYGLLFLGLLPFVVLASYRESFQYTYPFYHLRPDEALWPRLFIWELLYALQFVSLEFYFRGFLVHGTKRTCGPYSVLLMTIPYCMIHYGKPMPEALGAIGAGIVLGFLSLKTRSVWMGAAIHIGVAWTMDTLAILHMHGQLPTWGK